MKTSQAKIVGEDMAALIQDGDIDSAYAKIEPILDERVPFSSLSRMGEIIGGCPLEPVNIFLARIAVDIKMGGWVVIGSALGAQLDRDFSGAFLRCREYIIAGDVWYAADILGERLSGPGLVYDFDQAISNLTPWRVDPIRWVRRTLGVSAHYWAKKSKGAERLASSAEELLFFLTPLFDEWDMDAAKGIGWGIKTLGKYYPQLVTEWLLGLLKNPQLHYRALTLRKAITYLSDTQKKRVMSMIA